MIDGRTSGSESSIATLSGPLIVPEESRLQPGDPALFAARSNGPQGVVACVESNFSLMRASSSPDCVPLGPENVCVNSPP